MMDSRVEGHPKRRRHQCYYGIPLLDREGKMLGTVRHFGIAGSCDRRHHRGTGCRNDERNCVSFTETL